MDQSFADAGAPEVARAVAFATGSRGHRLPLTSAYCPSRAADGPATRVRAWLWDSRSNAVPLRGYAVRRSQRRETARGRAGNPRWLLTLVGVDLDRGASSARAGRGLAPLSLQPHRSALGGRVPAGRARSPEAAVPEHRAGAVVGDEEGVNALTGQPDGEVFAKGLSASGVAMMGFWNVLGNLAGRPSMLWKLSWLLFCLVIICLFGPQTLTKIVPYVLAGALDSPDEMLTKAREFGEIQWSRFTRIVLPCVSWLVLTGTLVEIFLRR